MYDKTDPDIHVECSWLSFRGTGCDSDSFHFSNRVHALFHSLDKLTIGLLCTDCTVRVLPCIINPIHVQCFGESFNSSITFSRLVIFY
uniref:Uncharacterized protein n=1 Tax=Arundo donax TaxID=35708 RepID=A0A0A9HA57_ARUDO